MFSLICSQASPVLPQFHRGKGKGKVKVSVEQATNVQRGSRGIDLLFPYPQR